VQRLSQCPLQWLFIIPLVYCILSIILLVFYTSGKARWYSKRNYSVSSSLIPFITFLYPFLTFIFFTRASECFLMIAALVSGKFYVCTRVEFLLRFTAVCFETHVLRHAGRQLSGQREWTVPYMRDRWQPCVMVDGCKPK
jgi:hypothetical protein